MTSFTNCSHWTGDDCNHVRCYLSETDGCIERPETRTKCEFCGDKCEGGTQCEVCEAKYPYCTEKYLICSDFKQQTTEECLKQVPCNFQSASDDDEWYRELVRYRNGIIIQEDAEVLNCNAWDCSNPQFIGVECDSTNGYYGQLVSDGCTAKDKNALVSGCKQGCVAFQMYVEGYTYMSGVFTMSGKFFNDKPVYEHESGDYFVFSRISENLLTKWVRSVGEVSNDWTIVSGFSSGYNQDVPWASLWDHGDIVTPPCSDTCTIGSTNLGLNTIRCITARTEASDVDKFYDFWNPGVNQVSSSRPRIGKYLTVEGYCELSVEDNNATECVNTPNYPYIFFNHAFNSPEVCLITVTNDASLRVVGFDILNQMAGNSNDMTDGDTLRVAGLRMSSERDFPSKLYKDEIIYWQRSPAQELKHPHVRESRGWKLCFQGPEGVEEHDTSCTYDIADTEDGEMVFHVSNREIRSSKKRRFLVGNGSYSTRKFSGGDMCSKENSNSKARVVWLDFGRCSAANNTVRETRICVFDFTICPCSDEFPDDCKYEINRGGNSDIRFLVSNNTIWSDVYDEIFIGQGTYAQGFYDRGDVCSGIEDTVVIRSARLMWLDNSRCLEQDNFVAKDKLCTYTVNVCPCGSRASRIELTTFGELTTILIAVIIVLGCFIISRYTTRRCKDTSKPGPSLEMLDLYEDVADDMNDEFFGGDVGDAFTPSAVQLDDINSGATTAIAHRRDVFAVDLPDTESDNTNLDNSHSAGLHEEDPMRLRFDAGGGLLLSPVQNTQQPFAGAGVLQDTVLITREQLLLIRQELLNAQQGI